MKVEIQPVGTFNPQKDTQNSWVWVNSNGDGGSIVVFTDWVVHLCTKAQGSSIHTIGDEPENCPKGCGVRFYPKAWEQTRALHGI